MPLVRIDAIEGRSKDDIKNLLDAVHRAIVSAFAVPQRDRYQIYQEHSESTLVVEDTGLGIERTRKVVVITLTSRPRGRITPALIRDRSLRVRWLKNRAAIEYSFTPLGDTLEAPVRYLYNWTRANCFPYSSRP